MLKKGYEFDIVEFVIKKMKEYNYINDEIYANQFVKFKTSKNGKKKILMELKLNGVNEEVAKKSIENFSKDSENVSVVLEKYLKNKPLDLKTKQKAFRHLMSRGYEMEDIMLALNKFFKEI